MLSPTAPSPTTSACGGGPSPAPAKSSVKSDVLRGLRCTPSRRSLKFSASPHARHFLAFDTAISRETRLVLFMELFVFRQRLIDAAVVPAFTAATYTPEELLEVRVVTDPRHPAYGQAGLYAKSAISHNTIVTPYSGFIEVFATSCNSRTYTMGFGSIGDDYALDAEFVGNYGRYANDPRGVGTLQANLSAENRFNSRGESFTALVARRQIAAGEEILMSYGKAHRLSATPWTTVQGEPMIRPRMGGVVPFPAFRIGDTSLAAATATAMTTTSREVRGGAAVLSTGAASEKAKSCTTTCTAGAETDTPPTAISAMKSTVAHSCVAADAEMTASPSLCKGGITGGGNAVAPPSPPPPLPSVANDLLWECVQCGMWTLCEASLADTPQPCSACRAPKLSGARLISLLSSPAITQDNLLAEARWDEPRLPECTTTSLSAGSPLVSSTPSTSPQPTPFSCEHVDWPMNVPFLPWQVWDAAVPLSVVVRHSRFETQEHLFLYTVDTGLSEETTKKRRKRSREATAACATENEQEHAQRSSSVVTKGAHGNQVCRGTDADEEGEGEGDDARRTRALPTTSRTSAPSAEASRSRREGRRGGRSSGVANRRGRKAVLWERQGDVDPEDLARLNSALTPTTPLTSSSPTATEVPHFVNVFSRFSLSPRELQGRGLHTYLNAAEGRASGDDTTARGSGGGEPVATSPLSLLVSPAQEIDRLIVLHRPGSVMHRTAEENSTAPTGRSNAGFSPQIATLRCRLQCMTRRLFTGKTFRAGDVVSYVGGLVRYRDDSRCRTSDSCLEIPLRYFLPPALRWLCRAPQTPYSDTSSGEDVALRRFCQRVDNFSLVVTNEFMYCPCIVWEERGGNERDTAEATQRSRPNTGAEECDAVEADDGDEVAEALSVCNVALVMTLDSLGCPYACAVATKAIGAFEPLLARAQ
jgi:hypothetical protein